MSSVGFVNKEAATTANGYVSSAYANVESEAVVNGLIGPVFDLENIFETFGSYHSISLECK